MPSNPDQSLTTLCTLCHSRAPKYTCPACHTKTCSLPCVRKHKLHKHCSGTRDPTTYLKRGELVTASALNRDYTFLTSIQRNIALAGGQEGKEGNAGGGGGTGDDGKSRLEGYLVKSGVSVVRAPRGMKRSADNATCVSGSRRKRICWTVEWVLLPGARRQRLDRVCESAPIGRAYFGGAGGRDGDGGVKFYLKKVGVPANVSVLVRLDAQGSLGEALRGRTVEEFPTVVVWRGAGEPEGYTIEGGAEEGKPEVGADVDVGVEVGGVPPEKHDRKAGGRIVPKESTGESIGPGAGAD